jgi:regulator of replication initiation timing
MANLENSASYSASELLQIHYWDMKDKVDELAEENRKLLKEKEDLAGDLKKSSADKEVLERERDSSVKLSKELQERNTCIICCVAEKGAMVTPCGHASFCYPCIHRHVKICHDQGSKAKCPICRVEIKRFGQFFL